MKNPTVLKNWALIGFLWLLLSAACITSAPQDLLKTRENTASTAQALQTLPTSSIPSRVIPTLSAPFLQVTRLPGAPLAFPTPDPVRVLPKIRTKPEAYTVQPNDSLARIAQSKGVSINDIIRENGIQNPDLLSVGQNLTIPAPTPKAPAPGFKILPDSELVNGPVSAYFDTAAYIQGQQGYLSHYSEDVTGESYTGVQIVMRVSQEYSVNPRLLLAVLEYRSGWLTQPNPKEETLKYPAGWVDPNRPGLYHQLAWAANNLNRGYYLWRVNGLSHFLLADGSVVPPNPDMNAGTVGVQYLLSQYAGYTDWLNAVSENGFYQTYLTLFGIPFDYALEPQLPPGLKQPVLQLPFEPGQVWSFTGGPHGGWDDGSAWAALDFAPPGDALGCVKNDAWVVAAAAGKIIRADHGAVIEDLDGDGLEQTGWTILYMHIETRDRVQPGTALKAGDRIGHPSCEGGVSNGTHTHIARRYNGEWIPADGNIPFDLDNWISSGYGSEYNGALKLNGHTVEAWDERKPENQIQR
jgi:LasA protease